MRRFVETEDRRQGVLLPEYLDDWVAEENPARVIDVFVDELDLKPKPGGLERRRASSGPGSDHKQLDALARRKPLAIGGDRVEPSTQRIIPVPPRSL